MKKQILNLGKALNKAELKTINGGFSPKACFNPGGYCDPFHVCEPRIPGEGVCISINII